MGSKSTGWMFNLSIKKMQEIFLQIYYSSQNSFRAFLSVTFLILYYYLIFQLVLAVFLQALNGKLLKTKDKSTRREIQKELRTLSKEERKRQQLAVKDVIKNADVVLTTLTGALSHKLDNTSFDLVIIDEAAQALEIACWIALLKVMLHIYEHQNKCMHFH